MSMVLKTLVGAVLFATLCGAPGAAGAQQVIFLIRHAEQMSGPEIVLTEVGHRRAAALAHRLKDAGIAAIFTTDAVRTQETAAPTAKALGIQPKVVRMQDIDGLVKRIRAEHPHDRVLIVNHALNVRAILKAFGHPEGIDVARDDYEPLFVIVPRPEGAPIVVMLRL